MNDNNNKNNNNNINNTNAKNSLIVGRGCQMIANAVSDTLSRGQFPLILGGDHSIGAGSLAGILKVRPNTGVIWVDAHADINTPMTSGSGNMHGMPISFLIEGMVGKGSGSGEGSSDVHVPAGFEWLFSPLSSSSSSSLSPSSSPPSSSDYANVWLNPDSIVYVGLRDVDTMERQFIREKKIKAFTMYDIDKYGIGTVMDQAIQHLLEKDPNRPIHLSYDIDAVDPVHAPATGTAVRGGLTYREAHFVGEAVAMSGALASVEMVRIERLNGLRTVAIMLHSHCVYFSLAFLEHFWFVQIQYHSYHLFSPLSLFSSFP